MGVGVRRLKEAKGRDESNVTVSSVLAAMMRLAAERGKACEILVVSAPADTGKYDWHTYSVGSAGGGDVTYVSFESVRSYGQPIRVTIFDSSWKRIAEGTAGELLDDILDALGE